MSSRRRPLGAATRLRTLQLVARAVEHSAGPDDLVSATLEALASMTGDVGAALHLLSPDGAWLTLRAERGLSRLGPVSERLPTGQGPIGAVALTGAPFRAAKAPADHGLLAAPARRGGPRGASLHGLLAVVVARRGQPLGVLSLARRTPAPFVDEDEAMLEILAAQLALSLGGGDEASKARAERVERAQAQLRRAGRLAAIGDLTGSLAHEVNNPLTTVLGQAQLLSMRPDVPEPVRERLAVVATEGGRAAQIIQRMLLFAREYPPERRLCSLTEQVNQVLEVVDCQLRHDGIRVVAEPGDCPPIAADESQLRQAVLGLVQVARHAMRGCAGERVLTVRTGRVDGRARIEVLHTGEMPAGTAPDPDDVLDFIGRIAAGPELLAAALIAEDHGGCLRSTSRPEGGGALTIELPLPAARRA